MKQLIKSMIAVVAIAIIQCMPLRAHADAKLSLRQLITGAASIFGVIYLAHHLSPKIDAMPKKPEAKKATDGLSAAALTVAIAFLSAKK